MKIYILRHEQRTEDCSFFSPLIEKGLFNAKKLVPYLTKVNFFVESISPAAIQLWFYALSYNNIPIGNMMQDLSMNNEIATY